LRIPSTSVQIIQPAKVVGTPVPISPNFALNIMLSVVAGIFFGVVLAFFVEYLDTSIKSVDDIEKHLGTAVLGIIPQKVRHLNDPTARPTHSEPYRVMRTNLKSSKKLNDGKVICVTSASAGEGKTQTLFNLAYVCAEVGDKVILVDSDLHRPRQHKILQTDNTPGLCNVIVGEAMLDEAIRHTAHANLDFLPSGRMAGASVHGLIDTEEMAKILEELRSRYDRVLLDSPPMVGVSDASQLVRMVDGVVMVVQHRKYPRALAKRAKDMIVNMGGNLLGVVLNNINVARDYSSYYYKHQYYYYYPYSYTSSKKS
jgi:capsular exopolysaccharide synthesis family protein